MKPLEATHNGRCALCDLFINEGEAIVKVEAEWVHADCAEESGEDIDW